MLAAFVSRNVQETIDHPEVDEIESQDNKSRAFRIRSQIRRRSSSYLRHRKGGKAGIISDIEENEAAKDITIRPKVMFTQKGEKRDDLLLERNISERYACNCAVCLGGSGANHFESHLQLNSGVFDVNEFTDPSQEQDKDLNFVLKKLQPPKHVQRALRLFIPDTAAFSGGEVKYVVMTGKDKTLKFIKQRDKLTLHELRKFFHERRRKKDDLPYGTIEDNEGPSLQKNMSTISENMRSNPDQASLSKAVEGFVRDSETIASREVALVKYKDDSTQVLTEQEFNTFLLKRKVDKVWKEVQYIQTFTRTKKGLMNSVQTYFMYSKDKDDPLFERAKNEIMFLNGDIPQASEDYVPLGEEEKFEDDLKEASNKRYCQYLLYKIAHFLETVSSTKVETMAGEFVKDELGFFWLINLSKLQYQAIESSSPRYVPTKNPDNYLKEENKRLTSELETHYKALERKEAVRFLNDIMQQHYDSMKNKMGFKFVENYYDDNLSDEVFSKIHPDAPFKLSELLKKKLKYEDIRDFVVRNSDNLKGDKFYRDGKNVGRAVKHQHLTSADQQYGFRETSQEIGQSLRSRSVQRNSSHLLKKSSQDSVLPSARTLSHYKIGRSTSVEQRRNHSSDFYQHSATNLNQSRRSNSRQLTNQNNTYADSFFKAIKYERGRRNQYSDNRLEYLGDEDDEDPAVSVYYQRKQTLRSAEKTLPPHKVRSASRSLLTQDSRGVMQVTENLSRNTYSDMQATQDVRPLEPTYKKGLGFKTSTRIALNFLVNMPKSKLRNDNLAVLLQESQSKPTTIQ